MTLARLGKLREYRCHIGHRFGLKNLIAEKREIVESALDAALAQSEELVALIESSLDEASNPGELDDFREEIESRKREQETLRELVGQANQRPGKTLSSARVP